MPTTAESNYQIANPGLTAIIPPDFVHDLPDRLSSLIRATSPSLLQALLTSDLEHLGQLSALLIEYSHPAAHAIATTQSHLFNNLAGFATPAEACYSTSPNLPPSIARDVILYPLAPDTTWYEEENLYSIQPYLPTLPTHAKFPRTLTTGLHHSEALNLLIDPLQVWVNDDPLVTEDVYHNLAYQLKYQPSHHEQTISVIAAEARSIDDYLGQIALFYAATASATISLLSRR